MDAIELVAITKEFNIRPRSLKEFLPLRARGRHGEVAFRAVHDVTMSIAQGSSVGLMGRNGSGKSTLLKIVAGVTPPTRGTVVTRGRVSPLLELGAGFAIELSGRENILLNGTILGMSPGEIAANIGPILRFAELEPFADLPVKRYSSGMLARLGFAIAAHSRPEILLLDEILAVGDEGFRERCFDVVRRFQDNGVTILMVSHAMDSILKFCQRAAVLDHGEVRFDGQAEAAVEFYRDLVGTKAPAQTAVAT
jgi:ABC-2 type transport system ATP-binding protein